MSAMDRQTAIQCLAYCDQAERALADGNIVELEAIRAYLIRFVANADEAHIRFAIECVRARAEQVLQEGSA